jgi:tRNA(Ile)-lysidine synthase
MQFVVAHVVHDMRSEAEAFADRDATKGLAARLGLEFVESRARLRGLSGNAEAMARRLRYAALKQLAEDHGCGFIATAHQADDQLETMLMKLIRGAGPRGLAGVALSRALAKGGPIVIRPALGITRQDLERVCRVVGWQWCEDRTNSDTTRARAAIRAHVLPRLRELRPRAAERAARSAALLADASALVDREVAELLRAGRQDGANGQFTWSRAALRDELALVLGGLLQAAVRELAPKAPGDKLSGRLLDPVVAALRSGSTVRRPFKLGRCSVEVANKEVTMRRVDGE